MKTTWRGKTRWSRSSASTPRRPAPASSVSAPSWKPKLRNWTRKISAEMLADAGLQYPALSQIAREAYRTSGSTKLLHRR